MPWNTAEHQLYSETKIGILDRRGFKRNIFFPDFASKHIFWVVIRSTSASIHSIYCVAILINTHNICQTLLMSTYNISGMEISKHIIKNEQQFDHLANKDNFIQ